MFFVGRLVMLVTRMRRRMAVGWGLARHFRSGLAFVVAFGVTKSGDEVA